MKRLLSALLFTATLFSASAQNPKANDDAIVECGEARFTILTPQLIRMEWSKGGEFEDNATLTFINRETPKVDFKVRESRSKLTITTSHLKLQYLKGGEFSKDNLSVTFALGKEKVVWYPTLVDSLNLMGTTRTLDRCDGNQLGREPMEPGLLSRSGWALVDDSINNTLVPDDSHWGEWVDVRSTNPHQDFYLFAHGHDYKQALADYQLVAGRAPLPPKYTFGYWWSRYWQYSDNEFHSLVEKFKMMSIPIDVLIVDMDWHNTWSLRKKNPPLDEYEQRIGWTGYSWQRELFPSPSAFLKWTGDQGLKVALNLHPASGIQPYEDVYDSFVKEYDWKEEGKGVPFRMDEKRWADTYFKCVLRPNEDMGVDFWWLDWQQWRESKYTPNLSNTFWLNHTFYHYAEREYPQQRPLIYHRWGGLGSHRYPLAFSGDTYASWATLAYLPLFTAQSSNVNYGYWGHDIGGHMFKPEVKSTDPELYTRWLQYGVFTPIYKTHSTKDPQIKRYFWNFPDHQFIMRDAINLRYALAPYIYNAARQNYDTGVGMCRPMYYDHPEIDLAYSMPEQFMFGDDILATVIATPVDEATGLATRKIWFPEGEWYDVATGVVYQGNQVRELKYTLSEVPWYAKCGSIIPMNPAGTTTLQKPSDKLVLTFIPGADGELNYYEDDGVSQEYKTTYATTRITKSQEGNTLKIVIAPRQGSYAGAPDSRGYELRLPAVFPPQRVSVAGAEYAYSRFAEAGQWGYDGYSLSPIVYIPSMPCDKEIVIELELSAEAVAAEGKLYGLRGIFNRCLELTRQFKYEQGRMGEPYKMQPSEYLRVSQCPNFITEEPASTMRFVDDLEKNKEQLFPVIESMTIIGDEFKDRLKAQFKYE